MSFLVSPGVHVKEIDLTNVVPSVDTTIGALAGVFEKGPASKVVNITSEADLLNNFGKPNASNYEWWFTASNFLQYADGKNTIHDTSKHIKMPINKTLEIYKLLYKQNLLEKN